MSELESQKSQFIELYDKYHQGIYRFLRIKLPTDEIAQDLTSDTFLRMWEYIEKKSKSFPDNPRAYLYKMAHNRLVDYYRKDKKEVSVDEEMIDFIDKKRGNASISSVFDGRDFVELSRIYDAIKSLSDDNAQLVSLKYIEDLSNTEIAEILGKSEGTVRTALSRAMQELREKLKD